MYSSRGHLVFDLENAQTTQQLVIGVITSCLHFGHVYFWGENSTQTFAVVPFLQWGQINITF